MFKSLIALLPINLKYLKQIMNRPQAEILKELEAGLNHQTLLAVPLQPAVGDQMTHYYHPVLQFKQRVHTKGFM